MSPAIAISPASGKNVEVDEKNKSEVVSRQSSGSSVSIGSQTESALQQVQPEGFLSPFHGGGALKKKVFYVYFYSLLIMYKVLFLVKKQGEFDIEHIQFSRER